ncbi:substrate-binding domain-containing protein [Mesorhizobium calcicola]|uniref:Substrate-binding domain-containing protein n=1 Tax=Mesorhizobium calcicola TaxID=1300310 RepID=A0ABW4WD41_9HYPH
MKGRTASSAATTRSRRGVIDALRERGLGVPGDVGVIGFDNWEIVAEATRPPLTSVDMNLVALGREAGLTLLSLVGGQPAAPGIRKTAVPAGGAAVMRPKHRFMLFSSFQS